MGGFAPADMEKIIQSFTEQFGLDKPILEQYVSYLGNVLTFDFGYSLQRYPSTVTDLIMQSIPWTLGLLLVTTIISFIIGNLLGAVAAWPRAPQWMRTVATPFVLLTGVPPVIMGRAAALHRLPAEGCRSAAPTQWASSRPGRGFRPRHAQAPDPARRCR